jgi:ABC-2 type transport system permease protein
MAPRYIMPDFMQQLGLLSPHTWALEGYHDVILRGATVTAILPTVGVLLAFAAVFFGLAAWRFRW